MPDARFREGTYGLFDYPIEEGDGELITRDEFEEAWAKTVHAPDVPARRRGWFDRLAVAAGRRLLGRHYE